MEHSAGQLVLSRLGCQLTRLGHGDEETIIGTLGGTGSPPRGALVSCQFQSKVQHPHSLRPPTGDRRDHLWGMGLGRQELCIQLLSYREGKAK